MSKRLLDHRTWAALKALGDRPGTEAEGVAAKALLDRLDTDFDATVAAMTDDELLAELSR